MQSRKDARLELAKQVCALPYSRLLEWGITRTADITGLDTIDLPVYTACRPSGTCITVSSGKGMTKLEAKAGSIIEGVELWAGENPNPHSLWAHCSSAVAYDSFANVLDFVDFQLARDAPVNVNTPICFDEMHDVISGQSIMVPSDMVWLKPRIKAPFQYFQSSSSGLAGGVTSLDALLQGVYEVVERDGWALSEYVQERSGQWPRKISLECPLPDEIAICVEHLREAGVYPFIFDLTTGLGVPVFRCTILDPSDSSPGAFSGFGCSLDPVTALRRAITEACQGRVCYIGGARDDLFRRKFLLLKNTRMDSLIAMYRALPDAEPFSTFDPSHFNSLEEEWDTLEALVKGQTSILLKTLYVSEDPAFCVVKVICPQLECPLWEYYATGKRAEQAVQEAINA